MESPLFFFFIIFLFFSVNPVFPSHSTMSSYIVFTHVNSMPSVFSKQTEWYSSMIGSVTDDTVNLPPSTSRIFYTYNIVGKGFAARLTQKEANELVKQPGVTAVVQDSLTTKLHTTRSPEFLGLNVNYGLWPDTGFGHNVIIGLLDSGIWPESASFNDYGLGPVPSGWKGKCEFNSSLCNKKLIGARVFQSGFWHFIAGGSTEDYFGGDYESPRDGTGHGTHTASIAAGSAVPGANMFGFGEGTARGIATKARIAMYKVCTQGICVDSDIFAAIESAIEDGVHVLSLSLGTGDGSHYENAIARGAFAAVKRGIVVACSAGNMGPRPYSVQNTAPWITTVGAASIDRSFPVKILLGNGESHVGSSLYTSKVSRSQICPLVYVDDCGSLDTTQHNLKGKIVVCFAFEGSEFNNGFLVKEASGVGLIQLNRDDHGEGLVAALFTLPAAVLGFKEGQEILTYLNTTKNPTASFIFYNLTVIAKDRAPIVAGSSSRGPSLIAPEILKPDLVAPGFNILGAFVPNISPTGSPYDSRRSNFNIISGTSMACPHVAGAAALLRAAHPDWSPAAIRSALMTTAQIFDNQYRSIARYEDMEPATVLGIGAGHINPQLAANPGLVYDASISDYINFLCSLNYTAEQMKPYAERPNPCSGHPSSPGDLNYPSFSLVFKPHIYVQELTRTLTNVGELLPEMYRVRIANPQADKVTITVEPRNLTFSKMHEKQSYRVKFERTYNANDSNSLTDQMVFGFISWESDRHIVRSPVIVIWR